MKKGFTLIELAIVISIIGILFVFMSLQYSPVSNNIKLLAVSKTVVSDLRLVQQKAAARKERLQLSFYQDYYTFDNSKKELQNPIKILNPQSVRFSDSGQPVPGHFGTIILSDGMHDRKIIISPSGRIRVE